MVPPERRRGRKRERREGRARLRMHLFFPFVFGLSLARSFLRGGFGAEETTEPCKDNRKPRRVGSMVQWFAVL